MKKPVILISNDDGIQAPGLKVLVDCVKNLGDVYVVAPDLPHSGGSSSMTVNQPLRITIHPDYNGVKMFSVNGTPVDCVKLAVHNILPKKPDFMFSGVNHGSNAGNSIIYSGTMGAAMEACMIDVPSVGFSLLHHSMAADFSECCTFISEIARKVIEYGLPDRVCLNVNFPAMVKIEGMKVCRAARSHWSEEYKEYVDPHGKPFYWLTGKIINEEPDATDTDLYWLEKNYASVVPATVDQNAVSYISLIEKTLK